MILKMSKGNKKLSKDTLILSISAGLTCPGSNACKAWVTLKVFIHFIKVFYVLEIFVLIVHFF